MLSETDFNKGKNICKFCQSKRWDKYRKSNRGVRVLLIRKARERAEENDLDFDIDIDDITVPDRCPALNIPLEPGSDTRYQNSPSIDRIDYSQGYVPGNVVVISLLANQLKSNASSQQLRQVSEWMESVGV